MAWGQTSPQITVSTDKVKVNGAVMFVHKVKGGETLYSLSKAYQVTIEDIVRNNKTLEAGLKEGSTIYIPSSAPAESPGTVKPFELSGENIKKYSIKKHRVKKSQTLAEIAYKYGVSEMDIIKFNSLQSTALKKRQVIYIPNSSFIALMEESGKKQQDPAKVPAEEKQAVVQQDITVDFDNDKTAALPQMGSRAEFTYILPLDLKNIAGPNTNFMDFYAGALLAADTLKKMGYDITINLIDQYAYSSVEDMVSSGILSDKKLIIGPVKSQDMAYLLPYTDDDATVVSPVDLNGDKFVSSNINYIQVPPAQKAQVENLVDLLVSKSSLENSIMVIYEKDGADGAMVKAILDMLDTKGVLYNTFSYGILEGRGVMDKIMYALEPGLENLVLVPSTSEAFVSDVVRNLNLLHTNPATEKKRAITLFGTAKWRNFETIEVDYFHRMNLHLTLPYYVDYTSPVVKSFLMKYRALFNSEPSPFAFQGFDITTMFLNNPSLSTQSRYHFLREKNSTGIQNTGTTDIVYNIDYTISVIE